MVRQVPEQFQPSRPCSLDMMKVESVSDGYMGLWEALGYMGKVWEIIYDLGKWRRLWDLEQRNWDPRLGTKGFWFSGFRFPMQGPDIVLFILEEATFIS